MLKLIHASDFLIDGVFTALTPTRAQIRREEQRQLLQELREAVVEREVDLVLIAGNLLAAHRVSLDMLELVMEELGSLDCPVFISPGDNDYYHEKSPYFLLDWPENVHIFSHENSEYEIIEIGGEIVMVYGSAFTDVTRDTSPLATLQGKKDWTSYHIMVTHTPMGEGEGEITAEEIKNCGMHYLALGHMRARSAPARLGNTYYTYCGSAQGHNFSETEAKGVLYLELERTGEANMQFLPLKSRQYHMVAVDITGQVEFTEPLRKSLLDRYPNAEEEIFRILLKGQSEGVDTDALIEQLCDNFFGLEIVDKTTLSDRIMQRQNENTMIGIFLEEMTNIAPENQPEGVIDQETYEKAVKLGLAALENKEGFPL